MNAGNARPAPTDPSNAWLTPAEGRQAPGALSRDKSLQSRPHHRSLFVNAAKPNRFFQEGFIDI